MNDIKLIKLLKSMLDDSENGYEENFANWFFDIHCHPQCGVECNNHYEEGPRAINMIGCLLRNYNETKILIILRKIKINVDNGNHWENGWIK